MNENREKLQNLAQVSEQELHKLFSNGIIHKEKVDCHIQGNLTLYRNKDEINMETFNHKIKNGFKVKILENAEIYSTENALKNNINKYSIGALLYGDTNLNIYKFDTELVNYLKKKYLDNFAVLTGTTHENFLINEKNRQIIGIKTNHGNLFGDHYVVAAGNYSKFILKSLGLRIPIAPVKGHALSVPIDPNNPKLTFNVTNDVTKIYLTQIDKIYRLSGAADF